MSKSSMTVRDVFELPEPGAEKPSGWKAFESKVTKEVKGIKTAALADIAEKVAELFEIPIPDIFVSSWKKADSIKALLEESRKSPDTVMSTELGEHTINSQHRPHIEVRIQSKVVKKIDFTLKLIFNLKGFVIKIQDGLISGMQTGTCDVRGKLEYQGLVIAEKKLAPITLPGSLSFRPVVVESEKPVDSATSPPTEPEAKETVEDKTAKVNLGDQVAASTDQSVSTPIAEPAIPAPASESLGSIATAAARNHSQALETGVEDPKPVPKEVEAIDAAQVENAASAPDKVAATEPAKDLPTSSAADEERMVWEI